MEIEELNAFINWPRGEYDEDLNAYANLIFCKEKGKPLLIGEWMTTFPNVLVTSPILHKFVENVEQYKGDNDLDHFVRRAKTNGIAWNPYRQAV